MGFYTDLCNETKKMSQQIVQQINDLAKLHEITIRKEAWDEIPEESKSILRKYHARVVVVGYKEKIIFEHQE